MFIRHINVMLCDNSEITLHFNWLFQKIIDSHSIPAEPKCALALHYAVMKILLIQCLISSVAFAVAQNVSQLLLRNHWLQRQLFQSRKLIYFQVKKSFLPSFSNCSLPFLDDNAKEMVHRKGGQWSPLINYRNGLARQDEDDEGRCYNSFK